jgi:hypothetical protein
MAENQTPTNGSLRRQSGTAATTRRIRPASDGQRWLLIEWLVLVTSPDVYSKSILLTHVHTISYSGMYPLKTWLLRCNVVCGHRPPPQAIHVFMSDLFYYQEG